MPGVPNGTWPTAAFAEARVSKQLRRYECPDTFSEGSARAWSDGRVLNASHGAGGYGPMAATASDDAGVEKHFVPETGVKKMQHGMLGTADVEIHGHPIALEVLRN